MLLLGDSIAYGNGDDPTGDGSDGLSYGGEAISTLSADLTIYDIGAALTNWPNSAGAAPDPGYMPHIGRLYLAEGFDSVTIRRWASNGATSAVTQDTHFVAAWVDGVINGWAPDALLFVVGTNNAGSTAEADAYLAEVSEMVTEAERRWPGVRIGFFHPLADTDVGAGRPEMDTIRGHIATIVAARATRFEMPRTSLDIAIGQDLSDALHPSLEGYKNHADNELISAWEAAS